MKKLELPLVPAPSGRTFDCSDIVNYGRMCADAALAYAEIELDRETFEGELDDLLNAVTEDTLRKSGDPYMNSGKLRGDFIDKYAPQKKST